MTEIKKGKPGPARLVYENKFRQKLYVAISTLVPVFTGGERHGFSEPSELNKDGVAVYCRLPVRPFRYCVLPLLIPDDTRQVVAWGIFDRLKGGNLVDVAIRPGFEPEMSTNPQTKAPRSTMGLLGPDGQRV